MELRGKHFAVSIRHEIANNKISFGCITAHYIKGIEVESLLLKVFKGSTTGELMAKYFRKSIVKFGLDTANIVAVVADTAGNMSSFGRCLEDELGIPHLVRLPLPTFQHSNKASFSIAWPTI